MYNFDNRESWVHFNQFPEMNRFVADSVKDILLPQQVEKRRTLYLKERFRSPMAILRGQGVHELFRGDTNFEKILLGLPNVRAGVERNTQNERRTVLQQLFKAFPDIQPHLKRSSVRFSKTLPTDFRSGLWEFWIVPRNTGTQRDDGSRTWI